MRTAVAPLVLLVALVAATGGGRTQEASPVAGCGTGPATPTSEFRTVHQEIAVDLDRLFGCLAVRDWAGAASFVAVDRGQGDPFATLTELDRTGLFRIETGLVSQTVRSTGPSGAVVDLAWRVGSQVRYDRWTFQKRDGLWRIALVEPGVPLFDGMAIGIAGRIGPAGVSLPRAELINPGGVELRLEVAPETPVGSLLLVFPADACTRAQPSPLTAALEVGGERVTLFLDAPADGDYALAVVSGEEPLSRQAVCGAPAAVLTMTS